MQPTLYSQHLDVVDKSWRPRACGIVALKTTMDELGARTPDIDRLITIGLELGAYQEEVGWRHQGLIDIAEQFDLRGQMYDWTDQPPDEAIEALRKILRENPHTTIASIGKDFKPENGGHLIVLRCVMGQRILYYEPNSFSRLRIKRWKGIDRFRAAWRQRIIVIQK